MRGSFDKAVGLLDVSDVSVEYDCLTGVCNDSIRTRTCVGYVFLLFNTGSANADLLLFQGTP